jgi:hypothetical protein
LLCNQVIIKKDTNLDKMNTKHATCRELPIFLLLFLMLCSCAGTIRTTKYTNQNASNYKKAYVVVNQSSQYIEFQPSIITPNLYISMPDDPAEVHEVIGNTDIVIKEELEKYGMIVEIGKMPDTASFDLMVKYNDTWRWDFKKILDRLEIIFISPEDGTEIAKSIYKMTIFKEFHNFPSPKKEVPKMIKQLLDNKNQ